MVDDLASIKMRYGSYGLACVHQRDCIEAYNPRLKGIYFLES